MLFEAALQDYEKMTGIALAEHPLTEQLQYCNSIEPVITVLQDQAPGFKGFREKDNVLRPLKNVLTVLHLLFSAPGIAQHIDLVRPKALTNVQCL